MSTVFPQEKLFGSMEADVALEPFECACAPATNFFNRSVRLNQVIALLLLIPGLPIIGLLMLLTKLSSPGPGIYSQRRVGHLGALFTVYKIRTMRLDAEAKTGPVWCVQKDPRVTKIGAFLRKIHLDELPQLFNVLRGEMVLVGPRPERPEFTRYLVRELPAYTDRLAARPGITGLAQILLPPDSDVEGVRKKLAVDLYYIQNANLLIDLRVLMCTSLRLIGLTGRTAASLLRLDFDFRQVNRLIERPAADTLPPVAASAEETKRIILDQKHLETVRIQVPQESRAAVDAEQVSCRQVE